MRGFSLATTVTAVLLLCVQSAAAATVGFNAATNYTTGSQPSAVASGDFNSDGRSDLVVANYSDNTVSVFYGKGDGTLETARAVTVGEGPVDITADDLNGDGRDDIVTANESESVTVLLASSSGFESPTDYTVTGDATAVAIGVIGSGINQHPGIVVGTERGVYVLRNKLLDPGTFRSPDIVTSTGALDVALADLDGSGSNDIAYVAVTGTVYIYSGASDSSFSSLSYTIASATDLTIADVNNDGSADLITTAAAGVGTWLNSGDGSDFVASSSVAVSYAERSVVTDMSADGVGDLVVTAGDDRVYVFTGSGDGTFDTTSYTAVELADTGSSSNKLDLVATDLSGDGLPDLGVSSLDTNALSTLVNLGIVMSSAPDTTISDGSTVTIQPIGLMVYYDTNGTASSTSSDSQSSSDSSSSSTSGGAIPFSRIGVGASLARAISAKKLRVLAGTASDPDGDAIKKVEIALVRIGRGVKAPRKASMPSTSKSCSWLKSSGRLGKSAARKSSGKLTCLPKSRDFIKANGGARWSYRLRRKLRPGTYVLFSRATDATGARENVLSVSRGNIVRFKVS